MKRIVLKLKIYSIAVNKIVETNGGQQTLYTG
jgi:hypothetical protein